MFFNSQKAEKIAPKVEQKLRKELGAAASIRYRSKAGAGDVLFYTYCELPAGRPAQLIVTVLKHGLFGAMVGELFFSAHLSKAVNGRVWLAREGSRFPRTTVGFAGDAAACEKLNADRGLLLRADRFARDKEVFSTVSVEINSSFEIVPQLGGSILAVRTLMSSGWFSGGFEAQEFLNLAAAVETTLPDSADVCECECHHGAGIAHVMACCHDCPNCRQSIRHWMYEAHLKRCATARGESAV